MIYKPLVMSNEEYHAKTKYESSSTVRKVLTSPKKYLHDKTAESVPTKAMEEGTAVHTFFLENELFVINTDRKVINIINFFIIIKYTIDSKKHLIYNYR